LKALESSSKDNLVIFVKEMTVGQNMNSTVPEAAMKREEDQSDEKIVNDSSFQK